MNSAKSAAWRNVIGFAALLFTLATALPGVVLADETAKPADIYPPWQHGQNNDVDAARRGLEFTVPPVDDVADFHGEITDPKLVLYVGGNYYFAMAPLVAAFETQHPEFKGRVFWETIPPGLLEKQLKADGRVTIGNMTFVAKADAYLAGLKKVESLIDAGLLVKPAVAYATNNLTVMVPAGNPGHVTGLKDFGKPDLRLVMPNPAWEGVARQIKASLKKAGSQDLVDTVYDKKVKDGSTILTQIHHRQTPLFLMQGRAQAGVTWKSEAIFQEQAGHPISHVDIPDEQNTTAIYAGATVKDAAHAAAAAQWLEFIHSPVALDIFQRYGFRPYHG